MSMNTVRKSSCCAVGCFPEEGIALPPQEGQARKRRGRQKSLGSFVQDRSRPPWKSSGRAGHFVTRNSRKAGKPLPREVQKAAATVYGGLSALVDTGGRGAPLAISSERTGLQKNAANRFGWRRFLLYSAFFLRRGVPVFRTWNLEMDGFLYVASCLRQCVGHFSTQAAQ